MGPEVFGVVCTVNEAGAAADGGESANPVTYINLTSTMPAPNAFTDCWFFVAHPAEKEVLAVALAALSSRRQVNATLEMPNPK